MWFWVVEVQRVCQASRHMARTKGGCIDGMLGNTMMMNREDPDW